MIVSEIRWGDAQLLDQFLAGEAFDGEQCDRNEGVVKLMFYLSTDPDKFFEDFIWYLRFPICGVTERSPYVDKTLEFVATFACTFLEKDEITNKDGEEASKPTNDDEEEEEEELPLFMCRLFAWLLDHHDVEGADARLRVCQLLNKLLKYMGEEACIDDELYNKIYD